MGTLSGRDALGEIDQALNRARGGLASVDSEFGGARNALATLRQQEIEIYSELAMLRLLAIEQGDLVDALDSADRKARDTLQQRSDAVAKLDQDVVAAEQALRNDEQRRTQQQAVVEGASEALDAAEARAQTALGEDAAYKAQLAATEQADFIADQAEDKAAAARQDRIEKGKPYESDPLFRYLWNRGYGTSRYHAFPLARLLDAWVARRCAYEPARRNYALLVEIPERLAEHAATMRAAFDNEAAKLVALEEAAARTAGVPPLLDELHVAESNLHDIDDGIAEHEDRIRSLVAERKTYATGEDPLYRQSIATLSTAMQQQTIDFLRERAARTLDRKDDELVRRLAALDAEADRIERNLLEFRRLHDRENERVGKLEDIRRRFKAERFDDPLSEFKDAALIALILREFLRGAVGSGDVWNTIRRQQRNRRVHADPNFGTLRFPKAPKSGPWRKPPGGFGGRGGFGGGGFRSGGGFRGGGFKTGGGF